MKELFFESDLTQKEIDNNFKGFNLFEGLVESLNEMIEYEKGKSPDTLVRKRSLPNINIAELRKSLKLTQKNFAVILGVSSRTVEAWESGKSNPTPTAKNLLFLIKEEPKLIKLLIQKA